MQGNGADADHELGRYREEITRPGEGRGTLRARLTVPGTRRPTVEGCRAGVRRQPHCRGHNSYLKGKEKRGESVQNPKPASVQDSCLGKGLGGVNHEEESANGKESGKRV